MASIDFRISYTADALPGWEASRALRGITHLYYYLLLTQNANYASELPKYSSKMAGCFQKI